MTGADCYISAIDVGEHDRIRSITCKQDGIHVVAGKRGLLIIKHMVSLLLEMVSNWTTNGMKNNSFHRKPTPPFFSSMQQRKQE